MKKYNELELDNYLSDLRLVGSLSILFSDSKIPLLHYRATEYIFCNSFNAVNLSRADISIDAKINKLGFGIKTFIEGNNKTFQKIAEFNSQRTLYFGLDGLEKIKKISELRNNRLEFTRNAYDINEMIYHCILRSEKRFSLYEELIEMINIDKIKLLSDVKNVLVFHDEKNTYKFDTSKSTLFKQFNVCNCFASVDVEILDNPLEELKKLNLSNINPKINQFIILPLYSHLKGIKFVYTKSGLNQWNAGGRKRNLDEVYIPFPAEVRNIYESFFPPRDTPFEVELPNGKFLSMKVCQDNGKGLMSNPNKDLGHWLLRELLKIEESELVEYSKLLEVGIDSVIFEKFGDKYKLNFKEVGSYEKFLEEYAYPDIDIEELE